MKQNFSGHFSSAPLPPPPPKKKRFSPVRLWTQDILVHLLDDTYFKNEFETLG